MWICALNVNAGKSQCQLLKNLKVIGSHLHLIAAIFSLSGDVFASKTVFFCFSCNQDSQGAVFVLEILGTDWCLKERCCGGETGMILSYRH
jgi:hypothetical protein